MGSRGTVVIPKKIRDEYNLKEGDVLQIFLKEGTIILAKDNVWERFHGCARGLITAEEVERELDEDEIDWGRHVEK